jgi:APA family basic amino acid/polyamine antiporter
MTVVIGLLALMFPLATLARTTSSIILVIFSLVNLSLWRIKQTNPDPHGRGPRLPGWLPLIGAASCVAVLLFQGWTLLEGLG